jgi:hypothetical protein
MDWDGRALGEPLIWQLGFSAILNQVGGVKLGIGKGMGVFLDQIALGLYHTYFSLSIPLFFYILF